MNIVRVPERGVETLLGSHGENLCFLEDTLNVRIKSQGQYTSRHRRSATR